MSEKVYILREDDPRGELHRSIFLLIIRKSWAWQSVGAIFGITAGMLSIILAVLLWAIVRFLAAGGTVSTLYTFEIVFFMLPLPLLALGVHCLDLLEKEPLTVPHSVKSQPVAVRCRLGLRTRHSHNN